MEQLEKKIREALPRLKELTKGCLIKDVLNECIYEVIENKYCPQLYSYQYNTYRTLEFKDLENFKTIGHDIKLNDVLEYWKMKTKYHNYKIVANWNLSSVYLKDQSDELKQFLNEL